MDTAAVVGVVTYNFFSGAVGKGSGCLIFLSYALRFTLWSKSVMLLYDYQ